MSSRQDRQRSSPQRSRIATLAARLMAEDGISDLGLAKRKAARNLGQPEGTAMPEDGEVEVELRTYQRLFQDREQQARSQHLLRTAARLMATMQRFNPYLTGSVLDGTAGRFAEIDIQLFPDSAKEVEIFLLNRGIDVDHVEVRNERVEAVLRMETDTADADLIIMPPNMERVSLKHHDGRPRDRIRADALRALLKE